MLQLHRLYSIKCKMNTHDKLEKDLEVVMASFKVSEATEKKNKG